MSSVTTNQTILIAGGGLSGVLLASRLTREDPSRMVVLIERESEPIGRLRSTAVGGVYATSYGLDALSEDLCRMIDQTLRLDVDSPMLSSFSQRKLTNIAILSGTKLAEISSQDIFTRKGARALGGLSAEREWTDLHEALFNSELSVQTDVVFSDLWDGAKKSSATLVFEQLSQLLGISDLRHASSFVVSSRAREFSHGRYEADWNGVIQSLLLSLLEFSNFKFINNCAIIGAQRDQEKKLWTLATQRGPIVGNQLAVAQSPWEALKWLPKSLWPASLLQLGVKARPASAVVISEKLSPTTQILANIDVPPQIILIPAEETIAHLRVGREIVYQTVIDHELSMQAPDVVKAVKRLKRARKKLNAAIPELASAAHEHLALVSAAWGQPPAYADRKMSERLASASKFNEPHLVFCGDSYGDHPCGDQNIISSVLAGVQFLLKKVGGSRKNEPTGKESQLNESIPSQPEEINERIDY